MKRYLNEYSNIGAAIFIALAIPSLCSMLEIGLSSAIKQEPTVQEKIKQISNTKEQTSIQRIMGMPRDKNSWFSHIVLAVAALLFIGAFFIENPFVRVGFFGGIFLASYFYGSSIMVSSALIIMGIASAIIFSNRITFDRAWSESARACIIALVVFVTITASFVYIYDPGFLFRMLLYVLPLVLLAYFIRYPVVSVGLVYAAAFLTMQEIRVFLVGPHIVNNLMALGILAGALLCILGQNIMREQLQRR